MTVRKPDMIGDTQWQFRHGKNNVSAPIFDKEWLREYHERKIDIRPGDALRCRVKFIYSYDDEGTLKSSRLEIDKVLDVIRRNSEQLKLLE